MIKASTILILLFCGFSSSNAQGSKHLTTIDTISLSGDTVLGEVKYFRDGVLYKSFKGYLVPDTLKRNHGISIYQKFLYKYGQQPDSSKEPFLIVPGEGVMLEDENLIKQLQDRSRPK